MKVILLICLILCCFLQYLFSQPAVLWDKTYGGKANINNKSTSSFTGITLTKDKSILLFGESGSSKGYEKSEESFGSVDWWVVKLDSGGNKVWDKTLGGKGWDFCSFSSIVENDDSYLIGGGRVPDDINPGYGGLRDGWLIKLDKNGNIVWDKLIGGSGGEHIKRILKINENRYWLLLHSDSKANSEWKSEDNRLESADYWLVCIDSLGNKIWDRVYGGTSQDDPTSLVRISDNLFVLAGYSYSLREYEKSEMNRGWGDIWVLAVDSLGNKVWDKTIGGSQIDYPQNICVLSDGMIVTGTSKSPKGFEKSENNMDDDIWLIKLNFEGKILWDKTLVANNRDQATDCVCHQDTLLVSGDSDSDPGFFKSEANKGGVTNYWLLCLDRDGNKIWDKTIGGDFADFNPYIFFNKYIWIAGKSTSGISGDKTEGIRDTLYEGDYWLVKLVDGPTIRKVEATPTCSGTKVSFQVKVDGNAPFAVYVDNVLTGTFMEKEFTVEGDFSFNPVLKVIDKDGKTVTQTLSAIRPDQYLRFRIATQKSGIQPGGGVIVVQAFGGVPPYTYQLDNGILTDNGIFTGLNRGIYVATITDSKGCKISRQIEVK